MTSKRDLGPILAIAGAVVAIAAVIAGFIVIGGPGDARDRQLDEMTKNRLIEVFNVVQCAFNGTGSARPLFSEAVNTPGRMTKGAPLYPCDLGIDPTRLTVLSGKNPPNPGDISYTATGPTTVVFCANYRRPAAKELCGFICPGTPIDGEFRKSHPAGVHCYEINLFEYLSFPP